MVPEGGHGAKPPVLFQHHSVLTAERQRPTGWPGAASPGPRAATASSGQATAGGKAAGADSGTQTTCLAQDASFGQRWQHPRPVGAGAAGFQHRREAQPSLPVRGPGRWSAGAEGEGSRLSSSSRGGKRLRGALLSHSERCAGAPRGSASPGPERGPAAAAALPGSSRGSGTGPAGTSREPTRRGGGGPGGRGAAGASHRGHRPPAGGDEPGRRRLRHPRGFPRAAPLHPPGGGAGAATALPKMEGPCPGFVPPGKPPRPRQCVPPLAPPAPPPPPRAAAPLRSAAFRGPGRRISAGTAGRIPHPPADPTAPGRIPQPHSLRPRGAGGDRGTPRSRYRRRCRRGSLPRGWGWGRGCGSRPAQLRSMARQAQGLAQPRSPRPAGEDARRSPPRPRGPGRGERPGDAPPRPGSRRGPAAPIRRRSSRSRGWDPAPVTPASGLSPQRSASPSSARPLARLQPLLSQILGLAHTFYDAPVTREANTPRPEQRRDAQPAPPGPAAPASGTPKRHRFPVSEPHLSCSRGLGAAAPPLPVTREP